jgi:hypothetical protein
MIVIFINYEIKDYIISLEDYSFLNSNLSTSFVCLIYFFKDLNYLSQISKEKLNLAFKKVLKKYFPYLVLLKVSFI